MGNNSVSEIPIFKEVDFVLGSISFHIYIKTELS